jgi:predicted RNA-binding Zn-ribbon protein involved in translation (DUF1610 family)
MAKTNKKTKKILNDNWDAICSAVKAGESKSSIAKKYGVSHQALGARLRKRQVSSAEQGDTLKILTLDIENAPLLSFHWGLWQQNIGKPMRVEGNRSYMMTVAAKWLHSDEIFYYETRNEDDSTITAAILKLVDEADIVVGHNAAKFDMKKINAYAMLNGLNPPSPYRVIDTMLIAKKHFSFERNTLDYLTNALCTQTKSSHGIFSGFELWSECMKGNEEAWAEMKHYNIQDVIATEELYLLLRPWAKGHPSVVTASGAINFSCTTCGSQSLKPDGYSITNVSQFKRYRCNDCGAFSRERSSVLSKIDRSNLLAPVVNG